MAAALDRDEVAAARARRAEMAARMAALLDDALLLVPGAGGPPPPRGLTGAALDDVRDRALDILCPAGHAGLPQLALPALTTPEGPLGLGLVAARGADATLLSLAPALDPVETAP